MQDRKEKCKKKNPKVFFHKYWREKGLRFHVSLFIALHYNEVIKTTVHNPLCY